MANNTTNGDSNRRVFDLMNLLAQEEDPFFEPTSTAVAKKPVRKREEPIAEDYGSISEDPRSFIQRKADELYESGPAGAALAAIADILPGIPFVDIIDPPEQLSDPSSQTARNLLGAVGLVGGLTKTPQAVGRVATNIKSPWAYSLPIDLLDNIKRRGVWESIKRFAQDKPVYYWHSRPKRKSIPDYKLRYEREYDPTADAREFLYRKMFGLKPRKGKNIFIENADGTFSLNPKSKRGRDLMREVVRDDYIPEVKDIHSVFGGYRRKEVSGMQFPGRRASFYKRMEGMSPPEATKMLRSTKYPEDYDMRTARKEIVEYEDIWDFKMNPGEWASVFEKLRKSPKEGSLKLGQATLRSLVDMITKPVHVKGRTVMDHLGVFAGEKGPDPKVVEDFVKMLGTD